MILTHYMMLVSAPTMDRIRIRIFNTTRTGDITVVNIPEAGRGRGIYLLYYGINIAIVDISPPPPTHHR
jgi:hypothetical protein